MTARCPVCSCHIPDLPRRPGQPPLAACSQTCIERIEQAERRLLDALTDTDPEETP